MMHYRSVITVALVLILTLVSLPAAAEPESASVDVYDSNFYYNETVSYSDYLNKNNSENSKESLDLDIFGFAADSVGAQITEIEGERAVEIAEDGSLSLDIEVKTEGYYNIQLGYYPVKADSSAIKLELYIDGELPFSGASSVSLKRIWQENRITDTDSQGNQIRVSSTELPMWSDTLLEDNAGLADEPYKFYLTAGKHNIKFAVYQNVLAVKYIKLASPEKLRSYSEVKAQYGEKGYKKSSKNIITEAENARLKSERSIVVGNDKTSPSVSPASSTVIKYNTIGGNSWKTVGEWIEWEIKSPESGLYNISFHFKQDVKSGDVSFRSLYIDGVIPFKEVAAIPFRYSNSWQICTLGDKNEDYLFYLEKGVHTLRLKATLGNYAEQIAEVTDELKELNRIYTDIVMVTGPNPDVNRDYQFEKAIPDVLEDIKEQSERLKNTEKAFEELSGETGGQSSAAFKRLYSAMDRMYKNPETISKRLGNFMNDITSLASFVNSSREQPLSLDYIALTPSGGKELKARGSIFSFIVYVVKQFAYSFVTDYANVGNKANDADVELRIWIGTGRDQADIIRSLINESFTPQYEIGANVQLVNIGSLLPATLAGTGPDIYLSISEETPVDYALRHAVVNLKEFSDCDEVLERFYKNSLSSFYLDDGLYALPETMSYPMLFYRKDILSRLGIKKEDLTTWQGLLQKVLPELDMNYFDLGVLANIKSYANFLYQSGGRFYTEDGKASALDSAEAISAFQLMTSLFTDYGLPKAYDFANRFRSGQMPIAIAEYTSYNQLSIFAPEIDGLWDMMPIPGIVGEDGEINRTAVCTVTGSVILSNTEYKNECWSFLKWWTDAQVQSRYAAELETVMGTGARYAAADIEAMQSVNWGRSTKKALNEQLNSVIGMPYIAGSYYTTRSFDFAFRDVVYNNQNLRESLADAAENISNEIKEKRKEFYSERGSEK